MRQDFRRAPARNDSAHRFYIRAQQIRYAAELFQQPLRRSRPHTWYFVQDALRLPPSATLAMKRNGESVCLIPNLLDQMQRRRMPLQHNGFVLLPVDV